MGGDGPWRDLRIELGWNTEFEALVARIVAEYAARDASSPRTAAWIGEAGGRRAGCVFCVGEDDRTALLRILLVHPSGRGHGLGGQLVDTCMNLARDAGYQQIKLWTNHPLEAARKIYLERGFTLVAREPHRSFGVDLVG